MKKIQISNWRSKIGYDYLNLVLSFSFSYKNWEDDNEQKTNVKLNIDFKQSVASASIQLSNSEIILENVNRRINAFKKFLYKHNHVHGEN